jgi:hypothetical protein
MTPSSSFDLVGDEIPRLERIGHSAGSHTDAVTDAYCTELVAYDASGREGSFGTLSQAQ